MRPRSSNLPKVHLPPVGVVFAGEVILEKAHQVLEYVHVLTPAAHHSKAFHQLGAVLRSEFIPVPLARVCNKAAPASRRAISV